MIQVDLPAAFTIGHLFSFLSRAYLKKEKNILTSRLLGPFNIYLSVGFAAGGLFLLTGWPAWEFMYKYQWVENAYDNPVVAAFYILFLIMMVLFGNAGYFLGHFFYLKGKDKWVIPVFLLGLLLTFLPFLLDWGIWNQIGTYNEIQEGGGYAFFSPPFFYGWLGIMSFMFLMFLIFAFWIYQKSKTLSKNL